jgi:AcrR family transcriptional regulator
MGRHREFDVDEALDAALMVFWQKGFEGTSYEDLTRATGVARPGLYTAFGNKEALFLKTLDRYDAMYMAFMGEALSESTAGEVIRAILRGSARLHTGHVDVRGCLGVNGALACSDDGEPVRRELVRRRQLSESRLRRRLEQARQDGDLPADCDCKVLARVVMTVSQGMAVQAKAGASRASLDAVVDYVMATLPTGQ